MADNKGFDRNQFFSIKQIFEKLKECYKIPRIDKREQDVIIRKLQRDLKKLEPNPQKGNKHTYYYPKQIVEEYLDSAKTFRYFRNRYKTGNYKPNNLLIAEEKEELNQQERAIYTLWEEVGLTTEEGNFLQFDQFNQKEYLRPDELKQLGKKGLVPRDSLTDEEIEDLSLYDYVLRTNQAEEKRINHLFQKKKMEIMLTALFNQYFVLDEDLLKKDISNYVHMGKFDMIEDEAKEEKSLKSKRNHAPARRSFEKLQNASNYYKKKEMHKI